MMLRRDLLMLAFALASTRASSEDAASFHSFLDSVWRDAAARGLKRTTFDAAFAGASSDAAVLAAMRRQPEYGKPFGSYLASLVSPARIDAGARKSAQWVATLRAVEKKFGVEESILVSIWGIESSFGESEDRWDVFRSLATLAHAGFQHPFFGDELLSALKMLQEAHVPRRQFVGSWAGAMGQAQFLPSSYLAYAVDFDGDGYADIWRSVPDALASIANYLQKFGWRPGLPWGFEVPTNGRSAGSVAPTAAVSPTSAPPSCSSRAGAAGRRSSSPGISSSSSEQFRRLCARGCRTFRPARRARPDPRAVAGGRLPAFTQRAHRTATPTFRIGLQDGRLRGPSRFRFARRRARPAAEVRHDS
jgi:lytic murein transglycosylase